MFKSYLIALVATLSMLVHTAHAQFGAPKTQAEFIPEYTTVSPGQSLTIAMKLTHETPWHSYFINAGLEYFITPSLTWSAPEGLTSSELIFPTPHEVSTPSATIYAYDGTNYFLTHITVPATLQSGDSFTLSGTAGWQVCDDSSCLAPKSEEFTLNLAVADQSIENAHYQQVTTYGLKNIPSKTLPEGLEFSASEADGKITFNVNSELPEGSQFFEYDHQIDVQAERPVATKDGETVFTGDRRKESETLSNLRGILYTPTKLAGSEQQSFWIDIPFGAAPDSTATSALVGSESAPEETKLGVVFTLASLLFGGLILNLMPCVFPVIGLKIMGFVQQAGEDTKKIKLHGIAFTVGVLLCFLVIAAALYPIKATTTLGAQLQEPWVVFVLMIVMLLLALSMAGLFEIGAKASSVGGNLTQKEGISGSFFSGILAVVIATPCSAPFLGPAIGAAWKYDGPLFFIALLMMGVGLSLPYITLSFFPALVNKLPRPGAWMESFKQGMSFLLFATVGYLLWIYNAQVGEVGQKGLAIILGITIIAAASWIYGRWSLPYKATQTRIKANILSILLLGSGIALAMPKIETADPEAAAAESKVPALEWGVWSQEKVDQLVAEGTPVYVDFTARWCLTCQTNKAAAYNAEVRQFMADNGVVVLKADMTKSNPEATQAIQSLNRAAIPVNVFYSPKDGKPHVTSELLNSQYLKEFMQSRMAE